MDKSKMFVMVFDKERSDILNAMAVVCAKADNERYFERIFRGENCSDKAVTKLFQEIYDKRHEFGFCTVDGCEYEESKK